MPFLGIGCLFLFLLIGAQNVQSNADNEIIPYTQSSVENVAKLKASPVLSKEYYAYCRFEYRTCSWSASNIWYWDANVGEHTSVQFDAPPRHDKYYQYHPLIANSNSRRDFQLREFFRSPEFEAPNVNETSMFHSRSCFRFNHYIHGANNGLTLYLVDPNDNNNKTVIWARGGNEIDTWLEAMVDIVTNKNFTLSFEAYGKHGFVGLDQFYLRDCFDIDSFRCFFEGGMCHGWTTDSFEVVKAVSSKFENPIDHTSRSKFGHFALYTAPENINEIGQARLSSPEVDSLGKQCLTFFFKRTSRDVSLSLQTRFTRNGTQQALWKSNDTYPLHQWIGVQEMITVSEKMKFVFEAIISENSDVDDSIAIDDISLKPHCDTLFSTEFVFGFGGWEPNRDLGLRWSLGDGRVERADMLKKKENIFAKNDLVSSIYRKPVVYSDFTMISDNETASMELISQLVPPHQNGGNCFWVDFNVIAHGPGDDFLISQLNSHDKRKVLWKFTDLNRTAVPRLEDFWFRKGVWIPNLSADEPSRIALTAKSSNAFTRIALGEIRLLTELEDIQEICANSFHSSTEPTL